VALVVRYLRGVCRLGQKGIKKKAFRNPASRRTETIILRPEHPLGKKENTFKKGGFKPFAAGL